MEGAPHFLLGNLSESHRQNALARFRIIRPFLDAEVSLTAIAEKNDVPVRTARRWVRHYRQHGLPGLVRKGRADADQLPYPLKDFIEGLALQKPQPSAAKGGAAKQDKEREALPHDIPVSARNPRSCRSGGLRPFLSVRRMHPLDGNKP
jgi:transposase-like protein